MAATHPSPDEVFAEALKRKPGDERSAYVAEACGEDSSLRQRVVRLLRAYVEAGSFLESPAADPIPTFDEPSTELAGTVIGPYKLLEKIGEGGFGIVYRADQLQPVRRQVALKIIKPGMDTREVIARFEAERQALALMDHPNIAKVLDAGATEHGRPYFVMELVKGVPITDYCDHSNLTTRERLELFVDVCQAVQHAHQKGIIHRDVKPTNVMIAMQDGRPMAKIIDFGVAKAINQRLTEQTLVTGFSQMVGTPLYMSPEQAEMGPLDVDTRSDIYSLGVLLYELLTGTTPFAKERLKEASYDELRRIIREEEPPKPSTRLSTLDGKALSTVAEHRRSHSRKLSQLVRGDLDWIAMKALEKDRTRRYDTAATFARDIERYLNDEPVEACPPSAAYRFGKFARRNRLTLAAGGIVAVAMLVALGALGISNRLIARERNAAQAAEKEAQKQKTEAIRQSELVRIKAEEAERERRRAEENLRQSREAVDRLFTQVAEEIQWEPHMEQIRRELLEDALEFYLGFLDQKGDDPALRLETALAYRRVGSAHRALGDRSKANEAFRRGNDLLRALQQEFGNDPKYREALAESYLTLGKSLVDENRFDEADRCYEQALALWTDLANDFPTEPKYRKSIVNWYGTRADSLMTNRQRYEEAEKLIRRGLAEREKLNVDFPNLVDEGLGGADTSYALAKILISLGKFQASEEIFRKVKAIHEERARQRGEAKASMSRFIDYHLARIALKQNRPREAAKLSREPISFFQEMSDRYPSNESYREEVHKHRDNLLTALVAIGSLDEAEEVALRDAENARSALARQPENIGLRTHFAWASYELAEVRFAAGREQEAADAYREAFRVFEKLAADYPDVTRAQNHLSFVLATCPARQFRDPQRAVTFAKRALQLSPDNGDLWAVLGIALVRAGQHNEAIEAFHRAQGASGYEFPPQVALALALAHYQAGEEERARQIYDQAAAALEKNPGELAYNIGYRVLRREVERAMGIRRDEADERQDAWKHGDEGSVDVEQGAESSTATAVELPEMRSIFWNRRGAGHAERQQWDSAASAFAKAVEIEPNRYRPWYLLALTQLANDDIEAYRNTVTEMLRRFANTEEEMTAEFAAWTAALAPAAVVDYSVPIALAERAVAMNRDEHLKDLGAVLYRAGRYKEALAKLTEATAVVESLDHDARMSPAYAWYFLAMTHDQLGNDMEATGYLKRAQAWTEEALSKPSALADGNWFRLLTLRLLRHEAEELLGRDASVNAPEQQQARQ